MLYELQISVADVQNIADTQPGEISPLGVGILSIIAIGFVLWRSHITIAKTRVELAKVNEKRIKDLKEYAEELVDLHDKTNISMIQMIELLKQVRYDSKR